MRRAYHCLYILKHTNALFSQWTKIRLTFIFQTYALVESYKLLTSVTLNITVIGEYPGSVLDTTRLKRRMRHVLCEMKYLLQNEPLAEDVYKAELQLPGLTRDNRIVFTCRNLSQAKRALDFMYTYIGRALGIV